MKRAFILLFFFLFTVTLFAQTAGEVIGIDKKYFINDENPVVKILNRRNVLNEKDTRNEPLVSSAPFELGFEAELKPEYRTEKYAVAWKIGFGSDPAVQDYLFITHDEKQTYNFTQTGSYFLQLELYKEGTVQREKNIYFITVSESFIDAPNFFTPNTSTGKNDEWRVAYRSIVRYECQIYTRWGVKVYQSSDPAQGWDGRFNGKRVPAGVYFYVVTAEGADGVNHKLKGDINILN